MPQEKVEEAYLTFSLAVNDGWPPVAAEGIPCFRQGNGFRVRVPPFFIKDLSVGDVIEVHSKEDEQVLSWSHITRSDHSTVWVMTFGDVPIESQLSQLLQAGCNLERYPGNHLFAVDMPPSVPATLLDECFGSFGEDEIAVAYPSWRHEENNRA